MRRLGIDVGGTNTDAVGYRLVGEGRVFGGGTVGPPTWRAPPA